jgi:hypothetical protein
VGSDRVAVIVCTEERKVTPDLLREMSNTLIATHEWRTRDTHFGEGNTGKWSYWYHSDWLRREDWSEIVDPGYKPCPRCDGTGTTRRSGGAECPVCSGRPWRDVWDFGGACPVEWVRPALDAGLVYWKPHYVLTPDGRLHPWHWFGTALAEFPGCFVVPMQAGLS